MLDYKEPEFHNNRHVHLYNSISDYKESGIHNRCRYVQLIQYQTTKNTTIIIIPSTYSYTIQC